MYGKSTMKLGQWCHIAAIVDSKAKNGKLDAAPRTHSGEMKDPKV